jgi:hypothetical protein
MSGFEIAAFVVFLILAVIVAGILATHKGPL